MKILLSFDNKYAPHAATVIESIISNSKTKQDFIVFYHNLDKENKDVLTKHFHSKVNSLEFYFISEQFVLEKFKNTSTPKHIRSISTFLRLFASEILPQEDYIIYLDCDIVVLDDIDKITKNVDLSKPVAAVKEYDPKHISRISELKKMSKLEKPMASYRDRKKDWDKITQRLEFKKDSSYFNAGIMILNLKFWRQNNFFQKFIYYISNNENIPNADQDVLNHIVNGNFYPLEPKWNDSVLNFGFMTGYSFSEIKQAYQNPSIVHFVCTAKPWFYKCVSPYAKCYWKYRKNTPWNQQIYEDKNLKNIIKRYFKYLYLFLFKERRKITDK